MRRLATGTIAVVIVVLTGLANVRLAVSQCAASVQVNQITCNNPKMGCSNTVYQITPNFEQYGVIYRSSMVTCCSQSYPSFSPIGVGCNGSGKLADPDIRRRLIELAKSQEIMVSSCKGEFVPLEVALARQPVLAPDAPLLPTRRTSFEIDGGGQ